MSIEAMKQWLEAMEYADACLKKQLTTKTKHEYAQDLLMNAGTSLRQAIAEAEKQEPVGKVSEHDWSTGLLYRDLEPGTPLYTTPQQRTWVGLTDEDMAEITSLPLGTCQMMLKVEAKLKEKNT